MKKKSLVLTYVLLDFIAASTVWVMFYFFRKEYIEAAAFVPDENLYIGLSVVPFFWIILYAAAGSYKNVYYTSVLALFSLHFFITVTLRLIITTRTVKKIHRREIGFNTLLIGGNERAMAIYNEIENIKNSPGYKFLGFISTNGVDRALLTAPIKYFGNYDVLHKTISANEITEVIIYQGQINMKEL